jgi:hypothetical protein
MRIPFLFTFLSWSGRFANVAWGGTTYLNGRPTDMAAVMICTVFGFGFCIFDAQEPESTPHNFIFKRGRQRDVRFGFIRFARNKYEYDLPNAIRIR